MTINDVAKVAGVSKSTVSRFLNNGYVSKENRIKIQAAIDQTGYQSNMFARGLKTNKSQLIAIIIPRLDSFTATQALEGMNRILVSHNYQMVVVPKNSIEEDEISYLRKISKQGFDGIIVMAHAITDDHIKLTKSLEVPILFTGQFHKDANSVSVNDYEIGKIVAQYINEKSYTNVLYLSVSESDLSVGVNRKKGLVDNLKIPVRTLITGFRQEDAYTIMKNESDTIKFDLVVGATDNIAIGASRYLKEKGLNIPNDVGVIGIGNYEASSYITPSLTTLNIDYQSFGQNAAIQILKLLKEKKVEEECIVEYTMIERESTK